MKREFAPAIITAIVLFGFGGVSFLSMKPDLAGVDKSVVLYLLGAWQSMAAAAVAYWIGSSAGSAKKDETIQTMTTTAGTAATTAGTVADTAAAAGKKS